MKKIELHQRSERSGSSGHRSSLGPTLAAGIAGTTAILLVVYQLPLLWSMQPFDIARIAGSMTGARELKTARAVGLPGQYINGTLFVYTYRLALAATGRRSSVKHGMAFGASLWLFGSMLAMPVLLRAHPEVREGKMFNPGIFMRRWKDGPSQALILLAGHIAFGAVVGSLLKRYSRGDGANDCRSAQQWNAS